MTLPSSGRSIGRPWGASLSSEQRNGRSRSRCRRRVIIERGFSPDRRRQINDLPPAGVLAKDRVTVSTVLNEAVAPPVCLATHSCRHALISELARGTQSPLRSTRNAFHSVTYSRVDTTRAPISAQIHGR